MKLIERVRGWRQNARRFIIHDVLHADDPPHRLALGIAIGVFCAFIPAFGGQMILVVAFAWLLRANKLVGTPVCWLTNPLTVVPVYYTCYHVGIWILRQPSVNQEWWAELSTPPDGESAGFYWSKLYEIGSPLLLGSIIVGLLAAYPTYLLTYYIIRRYRLRRWGQLTPPQ